MSLIKEIKAGRNEKVKNLIAKGANLHELDDNSERNLLHFCVEFDNEEILDLLLTSNDSPLINESRSCDKYGDV